MFLLTLQSPGPELCRWGAAREIGTLSDPIAESSGLAISRRFPGRLYHVNDSGDTGRFFITNFAGGDTRAVRITGFQPVDSEDIAIGPCGARTDCLFIGDIGDNDSTRREIELAVVMEESEFPAEVRPRQRIRMRYPDGPHDAESLAVHPDGTIFLMTKDLRGTPSPAHLYRLRPEQWRSSSNAVQTLDLVTAIDFGKLLPGTLVIARVPTAMDISADGKRLLVLMYIDAVEINLDFSSPHVPPVASWMEGRTYQRISLFQLQQQEAIAYTPDARGFIYTTERASGRSPIMRVDCVGN